MLTPSITTDSKYRAATLSLVRSRVSYWPRPRSCGLLVNSQVRVSWRTTITLLCSLALGIHLRLRQFHLLVSAFDAHCDAMVLDFIVFSRRRRLTPLLRVVVGPGLLEDVVPVVDQVFCLLHELV